LCARLDLLGDEEIEERQPMLLGAGGRSVVESSVVDPVVGDEHEHGSLGDELAEADEMASEIGVHRPHRTEARLVT
jgi:hypothetical protein